MYITENDNPRIGFLRDKTHKHNEFVDVHEYTWTEVWDLCHEG